jgi:CheY-like chemotaxis protein
VDGAPRRPDDDRADVSRACARRVVPARFMLVADSNGASSHDGMSGSVLVVDDDRAITIVLSQILTADGLLVETAGDGLAALDKLSARRYDVVVTDVRMPKLDGPGLYRVVTTRWPDLARRVIFITGDALGADTSRFLAEVHAPTLHKPFDIGELRRAVQDALSR